MAASNLSARLATAGVGVAVLVPLVFFVPPPGFFLLVVFASAASAWELHAMSAPDDLLPRVVTVVGTGAVATTLYLAPDEPFLLSAILVGVVIVQGAVHLVRSDPLETAAMRFGVSVGAVVYLGCLLPFAALLHKPPLGPRWVVLVLVATWFGDSGAYFAGRAFGRRKLAPTISPGKTWAGAIGALAGAMCGTAAVHFFLLEWRLSLVDALVVGAIGGVLGPIGDLVESMLKRSFGVKDSGTLLPGHGGMLDRIDALLFVAPAVYLYLWLRGVV